tara:strand:- start:4325 stop:4885 length:561 start_codon:yes stop_codon:yes gene_type:complete
MDNLKDLSKITTRYSNRVDENKDLLKVATTLGKRPSDVDKFLKKYDLEPDDLLDVIEAGDRRRSSLMIIAAMNGRGKALRQLDNLLGFLDEAVNIRGNIKWSNSEAQQLSVDAVNKVAKEIGKAQQRAVSIFTSDMKNNKYDNMDLSKAISTGNIKDASKSKRNVLSALYYDLRDRFNKYGRRKQN